MYNQDDVLNTINSYYSTNRRAPEVSFKEALLKGLAPDGGLYMPCFIPKFNRGELEALSADDYPGIAFKILNLLTGKDIDRDDLINLCREVYNFDIVLEGVVNRNYLMRLDQGPTASFKDFAARMMGRLMQYFLSIDSKDITILTATSGDTGSAVANAYFGLGNIRVIILFPFDEVTELQRKQMTTLGNNIRVIAVDGKFDDCQTMVKRAFMDESLAHLRLSSANSINIGRLLPQSVYYFRGWSRLAAKSDEKVVFSVPCGNFGNLMGGIIAREMGLPVKCFVIATNENDEVPVYFRTGTYNIIRPSRNCISNAMNVGHPSNMSRIAAFYGGIMDEYGRILKEPDMGKLREDFFAVSVTDDETRNAIDMCYRQFGTVLEPHGAAAWYGLQKYLDNNPVQRDGNQLCISLETAHPAKFQRELTDILKINIPLTSSMEELETKTEEYLSLENNYELFRNYILKHY